jgi:flagellar protein FlaF
MLEAVRVNWRLWTILQAELLDPECQLPDELRSNVLSLAQFIDRHTVDIIAEPKPEKLDVLIAINRELAGGLFTIPAEAGETGERAVAVSA